MPLFNNESKQKDPPAGSWSEKNQSQPMAACLNELARKTPTNDRFSFQKEAYAAIAAIIEDKDQLAAGENRFLIETPTGSGKSHMQAVIAAELANIGKRVLIVTSRSSLRVDLKKRVNTKLQEIDENNSSENINAKANVVVMTYEALGRKMKTQSFDVKGFDLVMFDEVHNNLSDEREQNVKQVADQGIPIIGWTATIDLLHKSVSQFGYKTIFRLSIPEAIRRGILAPIEVFEAIVKPDQQLSTVNLNETNKLEKKLLKSTYASNAAADVFIENCLKKVETEQQEKTLIFAATVQHAISIKTAIDERLSLLGSSTEVAVISGRTKLKEQREIMGKFNNPSDPLKTLINVDILSEGFDDVEIRNIILAVPFGSIKDLLQRVGRGLRFMQNKVAKVYQLVFGNRQEQKCADILIKMIEEDEKQIREMSATTTQQTPDPSSLITKLMEKRRRLPSDDLPKAVIPQLAIQDFKMVYSFGNAQDVWAQNNEQVQEWFSVDEIAVAIGIDVPTLINRIKYIFKNRQVSSELSQSIRKDNSGSILAFHASYLMHWEQIAAQGGSGRLQSIFSAEFDLRTPAEAVRDLAQVTAEHPLNFLLAMIIQLEDAAWVNDFVYHHEDLGKGIWYTATFNDYVRQYIDSHHLSQNQEANRDGFTDLHTIVNRSIIDGQELKDLIVSIFTEMPSWKEDVDFIYSNNQILLFSVNRVRQISEMIRDIKLASYEKVERDMYRPD